MPIIPQHHLSPQRPSLPPPPAFSSQALQPPSHIIPQFHIGDLDMDGADSFEDAMACERLLESMQQLRPLLTDTNDTFQTLHSVGGSESLYCTTMCPMIDMPSSTISPDVFGMLESPMLNSFDNDMFLSLWGTTSSTADISYEEVHSQVDQTAKCRSATETGKWRLEQELPSYPSQSPVSSPDKSQNVNSDVEVTRLNWCNDIKQPDVSKAGVFSSLLSNGDEKGVCTQLDSSAVFRFSRENSVGDFYKQFDSSDSDAMEDIDDDGKQSSSGKSPMSKNLVSERKRRKKLNEMLYSLRAIVPKISKMDKASIVGDAITYVQDLQKQVEDVRTDISSLQSKNDTCNGGAGKNGRVVKAGKNGRVVKVRMVTNSSRSKEIQAHKILELEVFKLAEQTYHIRIHCRKGSGVLVQLTRALEALDFEIMSANLTSVGEQFLNTVVVKVKSGVMLKSEQVRNTVLEVIPKFGLHL